MKAKNCKAAERDEIQMKMLLMKGDNRRSWENV